MEEKEIRFQVERKVKILDEISDFKEGMFVKNYVDVNTPYGKIIAAGKHAIVIKWLNTSETDYPEFAVYDEDDIEELIDDEEIIFGIATKDDVIIDML